MARPANPNKEKIAEVKSELKDVNKTIRAGETAAKKKARLEERLAKLSGAEVSAKPKVKTEKVSKTDKSEKTEKSVKKDKDKNKLQVVKKRGRPRKNTDEDED